MHALQVIFKWAAVSSVMLAVLICAIILAVPLGLQALRLLIQISP